ncbi:MAG: protein-export chaperone SecB [Acholeplasmataceae bacterium]|jgi:preprotein translocase subunit SecB|nr:protein-export chaperone SecB [Acholeplasmataceae bacterium]
MRYRHTDILAKKLLLYDNGLLGEDFKIVPKYYKKITKIESDTYVVEVELKLQNTAENAFPLDINVIYESTFFVSEYHSEDELKDFLNVGAIQIIFPFIRSALNSLTGAALLPPIILPFVDVRTFKEKK